jgi:truncated hemoglobin YjbI
MNTPAEISSPTLFERLGGQEGIQRLLRPFYADVRQHAVLGPIFNSRIHDWPAHLAKIGEFWARQAGGPSRYAGGFGAVHLELISAASAAEMSALAHRIGENLLRILEGRGGLRIGA